MVERGALSDLLRDPERYITTARLYGIHRGYVRDVDDPKRRGRIRVFIPRIHPHDTPDEALPWAEGCFIDGGGKGYGDFHVPYEKGDTVWVMFEGGDRTRPVWLGTWWGMPGGETEAPEEAYQESILQTREGQQRYPRRRVIKTRAGHKIEIGDDPGELEIVIMTANGNKLVLRDSLSYVVDDQRIKTPGWRLEDSKGNYMEFDTEKDLFSVYFRGDKIETIVGDVVLHVKKKEDGSGGNYLRQVEGTVLERTT